MGKTKLLYINALLIFVFNSSQAQWVQTNGPSGRGGSVYSICIKDSLIFTATDAGIYVSGNNGNTWLRTNQPEDSLVFTAKSIATNSKDIFVAKGSLYRSTDDGSTWFIIKKQGSVVLPVYEVAASGEWIVAEDTELHQTIDDGTTWADLNISGSFSSIYLKDSLGLIGTNLGIYLSTNCGLSWSIIKNQSSYFGSILTASGQNVYVASDNHFYLSTDLGTTWFPDNIILNCQNINVIACSPAESGTDFIFAGTDSGVFRSSDNGITWVQTNNGLPKAAVFSLAFKTVGTGEKTYLFAGTAAGIFRSDNNGESWSVVGLPSGTWYLAETNRGLVAGSTFNLGMGGSSKYFGIGENYRSQIYTTTDEGKTWSEADSGFPDGSYKLNSLCADSEGRLYAGIYESIFVEHSSIYVSDDDGQFWLNSFPDTVLFSFPTIASNSSYIFLGSMNHGIFRSTDKGNTWIAPDTGITIRIGGDYFDDAPINSFSFDGNRIYAGGHTSGLIYDQEGYLKMIHSNDIITSIDNGNNWSELEMDLPSSVVIHSIRDTLPALSCIFASGTHLLVGMKGLPRFDASANFAGGGIYHLILNNSKWVTANSSLLDEQIWAFVSYNSGVYAATGTGVYYSADLGLSWTNISTGMGSRGVTSIVILGNYIYAATESGVWRRPLSEITSVEDEKQGEHLPGKFKLSQNYPNPFNPFTQIKYSITEPGFISLKVYNLLGEEVKTLFEDFQQAGNYTTTFDAAGLSGGVYFYRLTSGGFTVTKKLILLK